jgi:hypothetical protein
MQHNMKTFLYIAVLVLLAAASCRPTRNIKKIDSAISRKDTTALVIVDTVRKIDSVATERVLFRRLVANKIDFQTFQAKIKVNYKSSDSEDGATANIRMKKDSVIWLSLTGLLNVEGYRVLITRDSVHVMNKLKKIIQHRSISFLQEVAQIPFDFNTLQDLIVGNTVFLDSNIVSYKIRDDVKQTTLIMMGKIFKHLLVYASETSRPVHSKLDDVDNMRNRTADITFDNYEDKNGHVFSTKRFISVAEKSKLDINLDFKQYTFDEPLDFPFKVSKNYKVQ